MKRVYFVVLGIFLLIFAGTAAAGPTITAASPVSLTAGDPTTTVTVATVSDTTDSAGSLTVNAITVPNGIAVGAVFNNSGTIRATITVACWVTPGANGIVFQVVDSHGATANATFTVNASITPLSKPTISATANGTGTTDQACPEEPLTLTATATGAQSYQWYSNNDPIDGATSATYTATGAATYVVLASNACYATFSDGYVVSNPTPHKPTVSVISGSTSFCSGGSVTLWSDSATGIQWYKDGVAIPGAGSESYTATQSGSYTCQLDALGCHSTMSDATVVTVSTMPSTPTISATENGTGTTDQACPEEPLTLTATSVGATSFQWYADGGPISAATSSTYSATGVGDYTVVAYNGSCASATSSAYTVQNPTPHAPFITIRNEDSSLTSIEVCEGNTVILDSDSATGIQWYLNGVAISGAGSQSYTVTQSGVYTAQLDALGCHSQFGRDITVTIDTTPSTPTISGETNGTGTQDQACPEQPLTLDASVTGATSYQWYSDNAPISGATTTQLVVTAFGNYSIVAYNGVCSVQSATYTVQNPTPHKATLSVISGSTEFCSGGSVTLWSDSATGIQWYRNGVAISGANSESYVATVSGSYTVILDALGCHTAASDPIVVTVDAMPSTPAISGETNGTGTQDQACPEEPLTLDASVTGATSYQWYSDNAPISGATTTQLVVTAFGNYSIVAYNGVCSVQSATYTVQNPTPHSPFISFRNQDSSVTSLEVCQGTSQIIDSDSATGIQWYKDGVAIPGANSQSYTATASGVYTAQLDALGCHSQFGRNVTLVVDASPSTPTISGETNGTGTQDQACPEQPLTLDASVTGATSYQWYSDNAPISGAITTQLVVTAFGNYSIVAYNGVCSVQSATYTVQNPTPHKATLSVINGTTSFCSGGSVTLWSDSATGIQWYKDGVAISGATSESYVATVSGSYTVILDALGCHSSESDPIVVTVTTTPDTPTISATANGTGTTDQACPEEPLTLTATSNGATSFQWYVENYAISGATSATYAATAVGDYFVVASNGSCSATSSKYTVQNPTPHAPFISFRNQDSSVTSLEVCQGTSQIIDSDSATGIQWYKDGVAIPGATSQSYTATASGVYTAQLDALGCHSQFGRNVTLVVDASPSTPTISGETNGTGTQDQACPEQPLTLDASVTGATSYQWYSDNAPISGATTTQLVVTAFGNYSIVAYNGVCSVQSATYTVQNPTPHKATLSVINGTTSFCSGGSVTLWSDSATGIQWYKDGVAISGATSESYVATVSGSYTVILDALGCHSSESDPIVVTVNPTPDTPAITAGGATTFCSGGSVTLTSSSASDNQWYLNGTAISGATGSSYVATATGDYTVVATSDAGCSSAASAATTVTVNAYPNATITAPTILVTGSTGNSASVASAGSGATYTWSISGGTITAGAGTNAITFTAGGVGTLALQVTVTTGAGCSSSASANVTVAVPVVVTSVTPANGSAAGGKSVTIAGSGFVSGASVTFGGTAATNVVVVSSTKITCTTPAHASGAVDVTVTDPNTISGTRSGGFTYRGH